MIPVCSAHHTVVRLIGSLLSCQLSFFIELYLHLYDLRFYVPLFFVSLYSCSDMAEVGVTQYGSRVERANLDDKKAIFILLNPRNEIHVKKVNDGNGGKSRR